MRDLLRTSMANVNPSRLRAAASGIIAAAIFGLPAHADINLEYRPAVQTVNVGDTINLGLYAVSDDPVLIQCSSAIQAIFQWDPGLAQLLGLDPTGAIPLLSSGFPPDAHGLNEANPPQDGDGMYVAWANFPPAEPINATPDGALLTTFQFEAIAAAPAAPFDLVLTAGNPPGETKVFDCVIPNFNVLGTLTGAIVQIVDPAACPEDINVDGVVDVQDLLMLLAAWGNTSGPEDINGDSIVDVQDLLMLLAAWGACP